MIAEVQKNEQILKAVTETEYTPLQTKVKSSSISWIDAKKKNASNEWELSYPFAHWLGNNTIVDVKESSDLSLHTLGVMRTILWVSASHWSF